MEKRFGPYRILAGRHIEDIPVAEIKAKRVELGLLIAEQGGKEITMQIADGARVVWDGERYACYVGDRKVAPPELRSGETVTLAQSVTYRPGCEPFMSSGVKRQNPETGRTEVVGLDVGFNRGPASIKFELVHPTGMLEDENAKLRRGIRELEDQVKQSAATNEASDLDKLSLAELRQLASDDEIDLHGLTRKEEIIRAIRSKKAVAV